MTNLIKQSVYIPVYKDVKTILKRILVTGAGGPASTNVIKSLRLAPEPFYIVGCDINKYRQYLHFADSFYLVPRATDEDYIQAIKKIIKEEEIEFIFPQPDIEVQIIGAHRDELGAMTFLPAQETIINCQDKWLSFEKWKAAGVPVPPTIELNKLFEEGAGTQIFYRRSLEEFMSQIKPPYWIRGTKGAGGTGSTKADNIQTIENWVQYWRARGSDWNFIISEYLPGRNIGWHSIWKDGQLLVSATRERLEYIYPYLSPSGITGTPTVQKTIWDEKVNDIGQRSVLAVDKNFTGLACVDLKEDKNGIPNPTEINPGRMFTTSLFFSKASQEVWGDWRVNFPYINVRLGYDELIPYYETEKFHKFNALPPELYYIRHMDMGEKIVDFRKL